MNIINNLIDVSQSCCKIENDEENMYQSCGEIDGDEEYEIDMSIGTELSPLKYTLSWGDDGFDNSRIHVDHTVIHTTGVNYCVNNFDMESNYSETDFSVEDDYDYDYDHDNYD